MKIRAPSMTAPRDVIPAKFVCTDFSIAEDWATGELSEFKMNYTGFVSSPFFTLGKAITVKFYIIFLSYTSSCSSGVQ